MINFGFSFNPYTPYTHIGEGAQILEYMRQTASKFGIAPKVRYRHRVISQAWSSETKTWTLEVLVGDSERPVRLECDFKCGKWRHISFLHYDTTPLPYCITAITTAHRAAG